MRTEVKSYRLICLVFLSLNGLSLVASAATGILAGTVNDLGISDSTNKGIAGVWITVKTATDTEIAASLTDTKGTYRIELSIPAQELTAYYEKVGFQHRPTIRKVTDLKNEQEPVFMVREGASNEYYQTLATIISSLTTELSHAEVQERANVVVALPQADKSRVTDHLIKLAIFNGLRDVHTAEHVGDIEPIEKMASVVKEKLADWGAARRTEGQPSAGQQGSGQGFGPGQQGQGSGQGFGQGQNPLQQGFDAVQGTQGQGFAEQSFGAGAGQGGQNVGRQGSTQGEQFLGQQGQSGQGSFQGGSYGQHPQGQSWQQGSSQQFQSGGTQQGPQGSSSQQVGSTSGSAGADEEHMDSVEYYQELARRQYATLKQECNALKEDPNVYEQCQQHAKFVRDRIAGMAEQNQRGG